MVDIRIRLVGNHSNIWIIAEQSRIVSVPVVRPNVEIGQRLRRFRYVLRTNRQDTPRLLLNQVSVALGQNASLR